MFQLTVEEAHSLRFQIEISKGRGGRRPYVFTKRGIAMLSDVLMSPRAIAVNIVIRRTFVKSRQLLAIHEDLVRRLDQLEWRLAEQFEAIQHLMDGGSGRSGTANGRAKTPDRFPQQRRMTTEPRSKGEESSHG
jgi:ORF6N domain